MSKESERQNREFSAKVAPISTQLVSADALLPQTLFLIPIRTNPVYPGMFAPLMLSKPKLIEVVERAMEGQGIVGLVMTKDDASDGDASDTYEVGTAVRILKKLNSTDGGVTVLVHSLKRFKINKQVRSEPYRVVQVDYIEDITDKSLELDALVRSVISQVKQLSESNPFFTDEMKLAMVNAPGPGTLSDLVAFALGLKREEAQEFLETQNVTKRFEKLLFHLKQEQELAELQKKINEDVNQKIQRMQRDFFLKEQLRSIKQELGGDQDGSRSIDAYREKIEKLKLSKEARKAALDEVTKLETTADSSPENNVIRNYLDFMLSLPWEVLTADVLDIKRARKKLDHDHFGIPKVKEHILEFLAVRKLNPEAKSAVLCLVGPPGVGKTSLGKSIAASMGRQFFRFSLGGMRDEAEIKGHRRTYVGAMAGKILNAVKRSGSMNPVILLDEVDKLGSSFQGDPASALLEVLDPEQNTSFVDHYLDVPFDLSNVLFIVTANTTSTIPAPLLDRMDVIELNGYTLEEKNKIARTHIIPRELARSGLKNVVVDISDDALVKLINEYSREPGMRSLQQLIATIGRKIAAQVVVKPRSKKFTIKANDLYKYLGPARFENEVARRTQSAGVVVGLAWTAMGGQILFIEGSDTPKSEAEKQTLGKSYGSFKITGQLGEVMNESASIAYSYIKKKTKNDKRARLFFDRNDIHMHIPAGAIPKDGPSAGVTMATSLLSLVTGRKVKPNLAMTGELSLVGKVLPVGGIREKVLAAKRAGIRTIVMPKQNKKDLRELTVENRKGMKFVFAENVEQVFKAALQ